MQLRGKVAKYPTDDMIKLWGWRPDDDLSLMSGGARLEVLGPRAADYDRETHRKMIGNLLTDFEEEAFKIMTGLDEIKTRMRNNQKTKEEKEAKAKVIKHVKEKVAKTRRGQKRGLEPRSDVCRLGFK